MSNAPKSVSEARFQENFVQALTEFKWVATDELNGNKQRVTVDDLINHWRGELNRINADVLEGVPLTDNEFNQIMMKVNQIDNSYEASKILSMESSVGKIDGIFRDDHPDVTKKSITLTIFKKASVRGGDTSYKIAREVSTKHNNRFDIVLLINGLPLINVEQKRTDKSLDEAFEQFKRYYRDGEYCNNFMAFSQMMVMCSEIETRYFATPKTIKDFNKSFVFHWTDKYNRPIHNWREVVKEFLMIPMAHQMVGDYLVIDEAKEKENRRHMLMRPYQVYALQSVVLASFGEDVEDKFPHGGFIWHTTGSGKTITSFKTALFLAIRGGFDKVVFLVDRRELDKGTSENFMAYASYESVDVDDTATTYHLRNKLLGDKNTSIIVTTTFKLNSLVKELEENHDDSLKDKSIAFIIDEAHRTTMGQMMGTIRNHFKKKGLFFGFTGTPLFDENEAKGKVNEKSELINTTEKLFGPMLHKYTIDEAISDGNVLGFHVDYINTGEFRSYDDLRERLMDDLKEKKPEMSEREIEREIQGLSDLEVEKRALKEGGLVYQDETHIPRVVTEILDNWEKQSQKKDFNAILTVAKKQRVIDYYHEFKKQMASREDKLNVAMTFSFGNENDPDNIDPKIIEEMFKDYGDFTDIEFIAGDKRNGEDAYFEDLVERAKRGGSGRNPKNIDLVIVADQLLTGYDSKRINTLYVDRPLELQGLIQAYSRTNRVLGKNKEFGSIINFMTPKITEETVKRALELYGRGGTSSKVIVDHYETAVNTLNTMLLNLKTMLQDPTNWAQIKDDEEALKQFKSSYLEAREQLGKVMQYYEYEWNDETFGMSEHTWMQYTGAYKNLFPSNGGDDEEVFIYDLVSKTKLAGTQVIDAPHIINLIGSKVVTENGVQTVDSETLRIIYEQIQELSNMGDDEQARLLKVFVDDELVTGHIPSNVNFDVAFDEWKSNIKTKVMIDYATEWKIDVYHLIRSVNAYNGGDKIPYRDDIANSMKLEEGTPKLKVLRAKKDLLDNLQKWVPEVKKKYN